MDFSRILWSAAQAGVIGAVVGAIVYGIRYTIWKNRVPTAIEALRWPLAIVIGIALIVAEQSIRTTLQGTVINGLIVYLIAQALRNEEVIDESKKEEREEAGGVSLNTETNEPVRKETGAVRGKRTKHIGLWATGLVLVAALAGVVWMQLRSEEWILYRSTTGGFVVEAPGSFQEQRETLQTPHGPLEMYTFDCKSKGERPWFTLMYTDYPSSILMQGSETILNSSRDGAVARIRGQLLSEQRISLNGYPGREIIVESGQVEGKIRLYLVKQRLYGVMATTFHSQLSSREVSRFLDSFKLLVE
jgi:hypothetical protein